MVRRLGAALHRDPGRLVEHEQIVVLVEGDGGEKVAVGLRQACCGGGGGATSGSGGTRTVWPSASRVLALALPPSTLTCPVRSSFSSRLWGRPA